MQTDGWMEARIDRWRDRDAEVVGQRKSASVTSTCYCWWPVPPLHLDKTDLE